LYGHYLLGNNIHKVKNHQIMEKQLQLIMYAIFMALAGLTTYGQEPGLDAEFEQSGITYKVTSTSPDPYEVKVVGNTNQLW